MSATNQNTVGLANFNVDFSIVKITPSEEYAGLGISLSQRRRENAEEGPLHRIARKLGLLFEQIVPPIPDLIVGITGVAQQITVQNSILLDSVDCRKCECPQTRRGISPLLS
jgi:hypothetical protein